MIVLCLVDQSEAALNALRFYSKNFHKSENEVHIYHVILQNKDNISDDPTDTKALHAAHEQEGKINNLEYEGFWECDNFLYESLIF